MVLVLLHVWPPISILQGASITKANSKTLKLAFLPNVLKYIVGIHPDHHHSPFPPRPKLLTNSFCSLCWREEKVTGMICLALAFIFLILWSVSSTTINHLIINWKPRSLVWLVAAQVTGHPKTLLAGNRFLFILEELSHSLLFSALTFQRL